MKHVKKILLTALFLGSTLMSATTLTERAYRLNSDGVTSAFLSSLEEKYDMTCDRDILNEGTQWRCFNGPECGYTSTVLCRAKEVGFEGLQVTLSGFDDGKEHTLLKTEILFLR